MKHQEERSPPGKTILLSINSSWNIVNFRQGLVARLLAEGYAITVAAPADEHSVAITGLGCRYIALPMQSRGRSPTADLCLFGRYLQIMRRVGPDAYLGYTVKPNVFGSFAAHLLRVPTINNVAGLGSIFNESGWTNRIVRSLYRVALRSAALVFFQNENDCNAFVADGIVKRENTALLPGSGVDLARFKPDRELERADGPVRFLLAARLLREKGIAELVAAGNMLRAGGFAVDIAIVGFVEDGNPSFVQRDELEKWQAKGAIRYLGAAGDIRPYIAEADCVVLPTYYPEGTPRILLEAAAMGKPIITTDTPGCRTVIDGGRNGYLVQPRSVEALAAAMQSFVDLTPAQRIAMGEASRTLAETAFDEAIVADRYVAALKKVLR